MNYQQKYRDSHHRVGWNDLKKAYSNLRCRQSDVEILSFLRLTTPQQKTNSGFRMRQAAGMNETNSLIFSTALHCAKIAFNQHTFSISLSTHKHYSFIANQPLLQPMIPLTTIFSKKSFFIFTLTQILIRISYKELEKYAVQKTFYSAKWYGKWEEEEISD